ncbi:MAG TPA: protein kinase [Pyrinomonadaceae bacterium]|nr:protein kinase [Pyrinomonadaceae bacterium]
MSINAGTRLGRYEIRSKIGEGGMGEVYRARDEKLNRDVAIKVLPASLSQDEGRLHRFEQEAQAAGTLNHANILAVYDVGVHDGSPYVVSELLEGETLRECLEQRRPATRKAIDYAIQLAQGLAAAHDKGIIHRDIKPDNIFVTKDERVKILDFGLAKLAQPAHADVPQTEIATRKVHTDPGTVMGTVGYMSPEQVRGAAVDHRTDIFSFGAVLYETLSGKRAFRGDSAIETLNAILKEEPAELSATNQNIAPALERVVWHCLEKSPDRRFQAANDIAFALESLSGVTGQPTQETLIGFKSSSPARVFARERVVWLVACAMLLVVAAVFAMAFLTRTQPTAAAVRLSLTLPEKTRSPAHITVSPDGSRVVFVASTSDHKRLLWVRSLDTLSAQPLQGTDGAFDPFWSPDGRYIGYFANSKLYKIDAAGGRAQALCDAHDYGGGAWNRDGVILISGAEGLQRVAAQGGTPVLATKRDAKEEGHRWPYFLPDGRHFIFLGDAATTEDHHIRVGSLDSAETQVLFSAVSRVIYSSPGYLLFASQGALVAQAFNAGKLKLSGEPMTIAEHVIETGENHDFDFSVSENGVLAYQTGDSNSQLVWFDRTGKKLEPVGEPDSYASFVLAPDGQRVAVGMLDADGRQSDVWLLDLSRSGVKSRLTFAPSSEGDPIWLPDGTQLIITSNRDGGGHVHLYTLPLSSPGQEKLLLSGDFEDVPLSCSADGQSILFERFGTTTPPGIWLASMNGQQEAKPLLQSKDFSQGLAAFSPNGHFFAYTSDESGHGEVYVQTFPPSSKSTVSSGGGFYPTWRADGKEIFYVTNDGKIMAAQVKSESPFQTDVPQQLFQTTMKFAPGSPYAVTRDGSRFLINTPAEANNPAPLTVLLNWTASLKQTH